MTVIETMKGLIWEMRPWQWYKQSMVLLPLFFSANLFEPDMAISTVLTMTAFSLVAGSNYIINDILDREEDRKHPEKSERPIASGQVGVKLALLTSVIGFISGFGLAVYVNSLVFMVILFYLLQNLAYSYCLKDLLFVDIILISVGFVLRAIAGAVAISVPVSPWLIVCTLLAALLLAIGKRKNEKSISDGKTRGVLNKYTDDILDQMLVMVASALILSYSLYTFFGNSIFLMATLPFSYYAIFRYWYLIEKGYGGNPHRLLKDRGFMVNLAVWVTIIFFILYLDLGPLSEVIKNYLQV